MIAKLPKKRNLAYKRNISQRKNYHIKYYHSWGSIHSTSFLYIWVNVSFCYVSMNWWPLIYIWTRSFLSVLISQRRFVVGFSSKMTINQKYRFGTLGFPSWIARVFNALVDNIWAYGAYFIHFMYYFSISCHVLLTYLFINLSRYS